MTMQQGEIAVPPPLPHNREALGWTFLIGSFSTLVFLLIVMAVFANYMLKNGRRDLTFMLIAQQGSVRINDASGVQRAVSASDPRQELSTITQLLTDLLVSGEVTVFSPENGGDAIARMQLYSNADLTFESVDTLRFAVSDQPHRLEIQLAAGRLRLTVSESVERPLHTTIHTPHGDIFITQPGQYSITVDEGKTQTTVLDGRAAITRAGEIVDIERDELGEIGEDEIRRLTAVYDMLQAAEFDNDWSDSANPWRAGNWNVELSGQPPGSVKQVQSDTQSVLQIVRNGSGHADISVGQQIGDEVAASPLWLQLDLHVIYHDLEVCGFQGSECPLFVQIGYEDKDGIVREWRQGFYAHGLASLSAPYICYNCGGTQNGHVPVPMEAWFTYDIDILAALARQGAPPPARINDVTLTASGHSFAIEIEHLHLLMMEEQTQLTIDN